MDPYTLILLIALAVALATWSIAQFILSFHGTDRQKLQNRLTSEWRSDLNALGNRSVLVERQLKSLPSWLAQNRLIQATNKKLQYAFPDASIVRFLIITVSLAIAGLALATVISGSPLPAIAAAATLGYLPLLLVNRRAARRQRIISDQLPNALDFLSRVLRAGHSLSTGIQMMGDELPRPIGAEFRRCYERHSLGQPLEESLREMAGRVDSSDFAFFITAVLIQRQTGGDLAEVLDNISEMIRARLRLQGHVKAITAEGRLTGNVLVAFPIVLFIVSYFLNPAYAGVLLKTGMGRMLLCAAAGLQIVGLVLIRRIVNVRV